MLKYTEDHEWLRAEGDEIVVGITRHASEQLGDVVFAVVNLGRFLGVETEVALNRANNKFSRRFFQVEALLRQQGRKWQELDLAQMDELWLAVKAEEKKN